MQFKFKKHFLHFIIPLFLFLGTFLVYKNIYSNPRNWYDHYLYLTKSIIQGRVDIPNLPSFYHDKLIFDDKTYIPFPPGASFILIPFVFLNENVTQQQTSIFIGAIDIVLIYLLLINFTTKRNSILLSIFFGFGTSFFWSAVVGTTWFFAHVVAIFFLTISLLLHFKDEQSSSLRGKHFWSGIFFALSALTRIPIILSGVFYLMQLFKQKKKFINFLIGAFVFIPIMLSYNFFRFGNIFETGYEKVYMQYSGQKVSISENFGYFNYRNIPLHLYTFLIMPPSKDFKPSPFGMGILFTSPLLFIALKPKFKRGIELESIITTVVCAIPSFLHYAQGWVQFGYRFILDFIVFLMIILAIRFKPSRFNLFLILISVMVNFWGVLWAIELGW